MDRLARCASDRTDREALRCLLWRAVIACSNTLLNDLHLSIESSSTTLNKRNIGCQAHFVDMSSSFQVIESVEYQCKALEPVDVELRILDVGMVSRELHARIEFMCCLLGHLSSYISTKNNSAISV